MRVLQKLIVGATMVVANTPQEPAPAGGQRVMQEMKMEAPNMSEEDQYGYNMPKQYMCEACKAIMFHLNATITTKHPSSRKWKEYEVDSQLEEICQPTTFEGYGIKKVNGENRLNGPGLKEEDEELGAGMASIQMGGESWKKRMAEECRKITSERYEDQIYQLWQDGKLNKELCMENEPQCSAKDGKKKRKSKKDRKPKEKKLPKEPKEIKKKSPAEKKKITLETYLKKMAQDASLSEDHWTKPRSSDECAETLATLPARLPGKDEL